MQKFIVATDSGCDLSKEICQEKDIKMLYMTYELNGNLIKDTMEVSDIKAYYRGM